MKKNTGKRLEKLVKRIEESLNKDLENLNIKLNDKIIKDGIVYAEFDITVNGNLDGNGISWLFECRDRPSVGTQGVNWIEQAFGRKNLNQFDKVVLVSTTGFSVPAIEAAEKLDIGLRTVKTIEGLAECFALREFVKYEKKLELIGGLNVKCDAPVKGGININSDSFKIFYEENNSYMPFFDFLYKRHESRFEKVTEAIFNDLLLNQRVIINGCETVFQQISFNVRTWTVEHIGKAIATDKYDKNGKTLGKRAQFSFPNLNCPPMNVLLYTEKDGTDSMKIYTDEEYIMTETMKLYKRPKIENI